MLLEKLTIDTLFVQVELKNSKGITLTNSTGRNAHLNINIDSLVTSSAEKNDSGRVEKLFVQGQSIYYPIIANIVEDKQLIGYIGKMEKSCLDVGSIRTIITINGY